MVNAVLDPSAFTESSLEAYAAANNRACRAAELE